MTPHGWPFLVLKPFWIAGCVVALWSPAARSQALFPGAGNPSPVGNAALVRILLANVHPRERLEAAQRLGDSGDPKAIRALSTAAVYDENDKVRRAAAIAIACIRRATDAGAVPAPPAPVDPYVELVQSLYQRILGRPAEPAGLQYWVTVLQQGQSPADVQTAILGGQEFYEHHGSTPRTFIRGLYAEILGREATPQEVEARLATLNQYNGDRIHLAADFVRDAGPELANRLGSGHYQLP
jgi:HEAT repeat protein